MRIARALWVLQGRRDHWTERAERITGPNLTHLLGEDENGTLYIPSKTRPDWWDRRFCASSPTHWPFWLRSRLSGKLVWLESE